MSWETREIDQKLDKRAKFEEGDQFLSKGGKHLVIKRRFYDFNDSKFVYDMESVQDDSMKTIFEEDTVETMTVLEDDEVVQKDTYNDGVEPRQIKGENL